MRAPCVVVALVLAGSGVARAAPETMTRQQIIDLAKPAVDYSYWWGHGCWRTDGTQHGSCSGSCPDCTHTGSYGADCSGFVAKVWQVPGPSPVTENSHPYSTRDFRYSETHWDQIPRDQAQLADAFVYRNSSNTGGHIVLYESGDPWGDLWTYEARGCSYGIVHNLRTLTSSYVAIIRHNLESTPTQGTLQGVIYEDQGNGDMSVRIPGATVQVEDGPAASARDNDAFWSFQLDPGGYTVTAAAPGYQPASRSCTVTAGAETWCSIGLTRSCQPDCSGRQCGPDPVCGTDCGSCPAGHQCQQGQCVCQPDCTGLECGPDPVCGTDCGGCPDGHQCQQGQCVCQPDCTGLECGPDPVCATECGQCRPGQECRPDGLCQAQPGCQPSCQGRACGPDGNCGLSCGYCLPELYCSPDGSCRPLPAEQGKLYGYVLKLFRREGSGEPLLAGPAARARVRLPDQRTLLTDENGYYEVLLAAGDVELIASLEGAEPGSFHCRVVAGQAVECPLLVFFDLAGRKNVSGGCSSSGPAGAGSALLLLLVLALARRRH
ncbi:MAG: hypothetical protein DRI34_01180 [Deltaproteobacteria bacterium]|nr:MAG: hypothetical protein DRI34_01180 [Deltaproteobacteria bacterium]